MPALGLLGTLRWAWTQLTSMKTALFLLLLLAVAAVPGSLFPQRPADPAVVTQYLKDNPETGPWLDRFQLFDVYSSVWFSAIYLLLFISLIGCVIPRAKAHFKAMRSKPPRTPSRLSRMPEYGTLTVPANASLTPADAVRDAAKILRRRGYRVDVRDGDSDRPSVGAERGFAKELGNLVFHTSLIGVLACVAVGGLFGYSGQKIVVEGESFVNTLVSYDTFTPGSNFSESQLSPYSLTLDEFDIEFDRESETHYGQPLDFTAHMTVKEDPDAEPEEQVLKVNSPLTLGGTRVYLVGNGYAPVVTVRDGEGNVALEGPVVAVPTDAMYTSLAVVKAPDAKPDQLGFVGFFLPTAMIDEAGVSYSGDPDPINPQLNLNSYYGDLGLDEGVPSNVYVLETEDLTPLNNRDLDAGGIVLGANQTYELPDGKGSITFDGLKRYAALDIHYDPAKTGVLVFAVLSLSGLAASLFLARRRVWVRAGQHPDGRVMVEYGLLARGEDPRLTSEAAALRGLFAAKWLAPQDAEGHNVGRVTVPANAPADSSAAEESDKDR
ncbi:MULTISPECIES: cytochrome c biogenesis protein ResB [unclassified Arthrobacter]|uniref:cytochrome c biogenesis protein ResB n=1 Tax=unclassified Arthrobacter TaxID=235627 RepID=UPI001E5E01EA|nr:MULTISPECIES: cytochrome c biogenesis protein ResB [unclassified Arthrobacter]MCC9144745.1 cytochrome c biogenesis protein ResB [Arthrobacter sp. zg-Y919]MDK1275971.1 cytochrome c biogenesis protein ResB [Arthrobacter sp. zg.Y919]WIB04586.1 cytochrome c biogenesis protein ResB [Arthrobacter sp. zg-Y919]